MSDFPFGFGKPDNPDDRGGDDKDDAAARRRGDQPGAGQPQDPFSMFSGGMNPQDMSSMLHKFADMMSWQGGPVNWDLAKDTARHAVAGASDPSVTEAERRDVVEAMRLADHWLGEVTAFPSGISVVEAWSRAEWIERTADVWAQLCDPVAGRVVEAMGSALPQEMQAMAGPLSGVLRQMGGMMFGGQTGQALGELAGEVVSSTDVGLPLGPAGRGALLPRNVTAFGEGLGVPEDQVRLYMALRESAHHRLFGHVPWLRGRLLSAVEEYARGISIDTSRLEEAVTHIDPNDPESLQQAMTGGMFDIEDTPAQRAALTRLETELALVEGWVDTVVNEAAAGKLPNSGALAETVRRRRATGGPAERTFATLVGLELRPRRLRDAGLLWRTLGQEHGATERDAVWNHPDLMPTTEDLDAPEEFAHRSSTNLDITAFTEEKAPDTADTEGTGEDGENGDQGDRPES